MRLERGLTQKQVANSCGMADSAIRKYESGKVTPKYEMLQRIAAALDVDWMDLVPDGTQGDVIVNHMAEKLRRLSDQSITEDVSELAFYAGEVEGKYKGLMAALEPEIFDINRLLVQLNPDGKQKAVERVEELTEIPRYRAETAPQSSAEPQESTDTAPPPEGAESTQKPSEDKK